MNTRKFPLIPIAVILSVIYWIYLALISQMVIHYDAIGFENVGSLIYKDGWLEFFRQGPQREPIYLFTISISMHLGDILSVHYQSVQKVIQVLILFITQILTLVILRKLKINDLLAAITILYLGFSPAIVNTAFRLWSEIATYPFILAIIILASKAWQSIFIYDNDVGEKIMPPPLCGFLSGFFFVMITFVKAVFELIAPVFLIPYAIFAIKSFIRKKRECFTRAITFILIFSVTFLSPLLLYKYTNKKYNGVFVLTNRGSRVMYGNVVRRTEKLTREQFLTALAYAPGQRFCYMLFGSEACAFWGNTLSDNFSFEKSIEMRRNELSLAEFYREYNILSFKKMLQDPFQYTLFMGIESLKMLFWESVNSWYVVLPSWLTKLYDFTPFSLGLEFLMAALTSIALINLVRFTWHNRNNISNRGEHRDETVTLLFSMLVVIITYIGLHSFFYIDPRYSVPIAPLHLILIAFFFQQIINRRQKSA